MTKKTLNLSGLHCQSCKTLIEEELRPQAGIKHAYVDYDKQIAVVEFNEEKISEREIKKIISRLGYGAEADKDNLPEAAKFWLGLLIPLIIGLLIVAYFLITYYGGFSLMARLGDENLGYGLIFIIGLLASFHCVGMCGGLVVSYTCGVNLKTPNKSPWPHFLYNLGRLISYTVIGGILGGIGSFFAVSPLFAGSIMIIAAIFMLIMALNLITNFSWLQKLSPHTPKFIAKLLFSQKNTKRPLGPFFIGLANGLMPCGPLQAMQLYALATGSIVSGALSLFFYALGTIPLMFGLGNVIALISHKFMKKAMKVSAIIVALLALIMLGRGIIALQANNSTAAISDDGATTAQTANGVQIVKMAVTYDGYVPDTITIKKGVPVRWVIDGSGITGCTSVIQIPDLKIKQRLNRGENIIEFMPTQTGTLRFSCGMQMVWGKFLVN